MLAYRNPSIGVPQNYRHTPKLNAYLTSIGKERQATMYSEYIVSEYVDWISDMDGD